jgi:protein-S-isoprenylcysteine O-methyltransferase Ste14
LQKKESMNPLIPPPAVVAVIGAVMWAADRHLHAGRFGFTWQVPIAVALLIAGLLLMFVAVSSLVAARTTVNPLRPSRASRLVTTGIFGLSRNPIYLGDLLMLAALAVWLGNVVNVVLVVLFVGYIDRFQIIPEERALTHLFGESYLAYRARVRRWL